MTPTVTIRQYPSTYSGAMRGLVTQTLSVNVSEKAATISDVTNKETTWA